MKNKKSLLSVLLVAVLLCASVAGMLIFGANAAENTLSLSVGEGGTYETITSALAAVTPADLEGKEKIEITLTSAVQEPNSDTLFAAETIALPITVKGAFTVTANVATADAAMSSVNDFTFEDFTLETNAAQLNLGSRNVVINGATIPVDVSLNSEGIVTKNSSLTINSGTVDGGVYAVDGNAQISEGVTATITLGANGSVTGDFVGMREETKTSGEVVVNVYKQPKSVYGVTESAQVLSGGKVTVNINGGTYNVTSKKLVRMTDGSKYKVKAGGEVVMSLNGGHISGAADYIYLFKGSKKTTESGFEDNSVLRLVMNGTKYECTDGSIRYWIGYVALSCDVYIDIYDYTSSDYANAATEEKKSLTTDRLINSATMKGDYYVTFDTTVDGWKTNADGARAADDSDVNAKGKKIKHVNVIQESWGSDVSGNQYTRVNGGENPESISFTTLMGSQGHRVEKYISNCIINTEYGIFRGGSASNGFEYLNNYFYQVQINGTRFICAGLEESGAARTNIGTVINTFDGCTANTTVYGGGYYYTTASDSGVKYYGSYIGTLINNFVQTGSKPNSFKAFYGGHYSTKNHTGEYASKIDTLINSVSGEASFTSFYGGSYRSSGQVKTASLTNYISGDFSVSTAFYESTTSSSGTYCTVETLASHFGQYYDIETEKGVNAPVALKGEGTFSPAINGGEITIEGGTFNKDIVGSTVTLKGGIFKGDVTGDRVILAGGTIYSGARENTIVATEATAVTTIERYSGILNEEGQNVLTIPSEYADKIVVKNNDIRGYLWLNDEKLAAEGKVVVESKIATLDQIVLDITDRVVIKVLVPKKELEIARDHSGKNFTYYCDGVGVTDENRLTIAWDEFPVYNDEYYYFELPAIGAGNFDTELTIFSSIFGAITKQSVAKIAQKGATHYAETDPEAAAVFAALVDYGKAAVEEQFPSQFVPGVTDQALLAYAASLSTNGKKVEGAKEGAAFEFTKMTLLMGDTIGIRLRTDKTDLSAVAGATALYDGEALAASDYRVTTDDEGNVCFDFFVNAKNYETILDLTIQDSNNKQCLLINTSVALVAADLVAVDMAEDGDIDSHRLLATVMLMMAVNSFVA